MISTHDRARARGVGSERIDEISGLELIAASMDITLNLWGEDGYLRIAGETADLLSHPERVLVYYCEAFL